MSETDEKRLDFLGGAAIEREMRYWGHEPPSRSVLELCAKRVREITDKAREGEHDCAS